MNLYDWIWVVIKTSHFGYVIPMYAYAITVQVANDHVAN